MCVLYVLNRTRDRVASGDMAAAFVLSAVASLSACAADVASAPASFLRPVGRDTVSPGLEVSQESVRTKEGIRRTVNHISVPNTGSCGMS